MAYSYSALSTYSSCPLKYDLSYVRKIWLEKVYSYEVVKGLIFHNYAEHYKSTNDFNHRATLDYAFSHTHDVSAEWVSRLSKDEIQGIIEACKDFKKWWDSFFYTSLFGPDESVDAYFNIHRESQLKGNDPFSFTGVLDLYYENEKGLHIVDYKTPKNAQISKYRGQLELYAHFLQKRENKPVDSLNVYFAFATDIKDGNRLYNIPLTKISATTEKYAEMVKEIESPCRKKDPELGWLCDYCSYKGLKELCQISTIAGAKSQYPAEYIASLSFPSLP